MVVKEINQVLNYQKMNFYLHVNRNNKKHKKSQLFSSEWFRDSLCTKFIPTKYITFSCVREILFERKINNGFAVDNAINFAYFSPRKNFFL